MPTPLAAGVVIALSAVGAAVRAGEAPAVSLSVLETNTVYTATPASSSVPGFKPHINFPYMKARADGTLELDFTVGQTHGAGQFGVRAYSFDGGRTWGGFNSSAPSAPNSSLVRSSGQTSYGVSYATSNAAGTTSWSNTLYTSTDGGTSWAYSNALFNTGSVGYTSVYNNLGDIAQSGSLLLTTGYGQRLGASTQETILFASANNGANWTRRSTIASYTNDPAVGMGAEGPSESSVIRLDNGKLLSVFRTGQSFPSSSLTSTSPPLMWAMSSDDGLSWSAPKTLGVAGVFPLLHKLDDGNVALTFGRYGARVMFADTTGLRWTSPTTIYNGPGSGHTDLRRSADGGYCFVYDQSSFYPPSWNSNPPAGYVFNNDQSANMKAARLSIQLGPSSDDYRWAGEYHGDVAPDTIPAQGWTKFQSGTTAQYFWADQGQDYTRISTGGVTANQLYYQQSGASATAWQSIDFAASGAVIDLRARCSIGTAEGAGDTFIGDGINGSCILQLNGSGVILEGAGGDAAQVQYLTTAHPGFNIYDWHTYRTVIGRDSAQGGSLVARVYLDGDFTNPILTKALAAGGVDAIRFGDQAGANNGNYDVEFLRFSRANGEWAVDDDGTWSVLNNWTVTVPNAADAVANFAGAITAPRTVTIESPVTVGQLRFDNPSRYTLAGAATVTVSVSGGVGTIALLSGNHTLLAPVELACRADVNVGPAGSTLTLANLADTAFGVEKRGAGTLEVNTIRAGSLTVSGGTARLFARGSGGSTSRLGTLTIAEGASLDLSDNNLLVSGESYSAIAALIVHARDGGSWGGSGLTSSAARSQSQGATTLAALSGSRYLSVYGAGATFDGFAVLPGDVLVKYTWYGDTDLNGEVNFDDYVRIDTTFNAGGIGADVLDGDFDGNAAVDFDDYVLIDLGFNFQDDTLRRAIAFLDGTDRSFDGLDAPALVKVREHFAAFGIDYATHFLAAVPEPGAATGAVAAVGLAVSTTRRCRRGRLEAARG